MSDEKIIQYAQVMVVSAIFGAVIILQIRHFMEPKAPPSYYFLVKDRMLDNPDAGVDYFSGPNQLRFERVDAASTNVYGWLTFTNRPGITVTQWFRCLVGPNRLGRPSVREVKTYRSNPQPLADQN